MNEFFEMYADLTALCLTVLLSLALTVYLKRKAQKKLRAVAVYFFVFGPSGILSFIFFHLFENTFRAIEKAITGSFEYNFHFYSLILFGLLLAFVGASYLKACLDKCLSRSNNFRYFIYLLLILVITLPLIPITPIAMVPVICCSISVLASPFVRRKLKVSSNTSNNTAKITTRQNAGISIPNYL